MAGKPVLETKRIANRVLKVYFCHKSY